MGEGARSFNRWADLLADAGRLDGIHVAADALRSQAAMVARIAGALDEHAPLVFRAVERVAVNIALHAGNTARGRELPEGPAAVVVAHLRLGRRAADPIRIIVELAFQDFLMEGDV